MKRKLCIGEGDERGRFGGRGTDLDGLASMPARRVDMASSCFPTLVVFPDIGRLCASHEPVIGVIRERERDDGLARFLRNTACE